MPRYYCDYCDIFLTHDSPSVRKAHNAGWKHRMHVQNYYSALDPDQVEQIIEKLTAAYAGVPGGPDFHGNGMVHMNGHFGMPPPHMIGRPGGPPGPYGGPPRPGFPPGPPPGMMGPPPQFGRGPPPFPPGGGFPPRPPFPSYGGGSGSGGGGMPPPPHMPWMPPPGGGPGGPGGGMPPPPMPPSMPPPGGMMRPPFPPPGAGGYGGGGMPPPPHGPGMAPPAHMHEGKRDIEGGEEAAAKRFRGE
ncbi:U1 zinc finger-domain-containing protein [Geranomyces variabilis]|nr:U1 zinc finger-domain-containing protein [Geranomyces variabilis]KAJ3132337.1 hypothetical protein HDU90_007398 [Geranomyces variabilis]